MSEQPPDLPSLTIVIVFPIEGTPKVDAWLSEMDDETFDRFRHWIRSQESLDALVEALLQLRRGLREDSE